MSNNTLILGLQWGDEGKGKIVDNLSESIDVVCRFQGGHNAGHTIKVNDVKTVLHLIPSGILHKNTQCLIGNGVVLALDALDKEIENLIQKNIDFKDRFFISSSCPLILPSHISIDMVRDKKESIGTTGRGIGPAYEDKVARRGLRVKDLFDERSFLEQLKINLEYHNFILEKYYGESSVGLQESVDSTLGLKDKLLPMIGDISKELRKRRGEGKSTLFEGAQGSLLDIDQGTYPFVTSSNTNVGAISGGCGVGPKSLDYILGITKAYTTRVGEGPFPTEVDGLIAQHLSSKGKEFGSTTGRPRRCGWFDANALKEVAQLNSLTALCVTKLDVLDGLDQILICTDYKEASNGELKPIYEEMPVWEGSVAGVTSKSDLPVEAISYLKRIEELSGVGIDIISTGPDREDTIIEKNPFC